MGSAAVAQDFEDSELTIVTTASRSDRVLEDATSSVQVIDREAIESTNGTTIADLLSTEGGLEFERSLGRTGVIMQGLDPAYVLILIDGRRALGRVNGTVDLSAIRLDDVEQVEIVKGPQSALYGADALGGVINIITRNPSRTEVSASATAGSHERLDVSAGLSTKSGVYSGRFNADFSHHDGYTLTPETLTKEGPSLLFARATQRSELALGSTTFKAHTSYQVRDTERVDELQSGAIIDRKNRAEEFSAGIQPTLVLSPDVAMNIAVDYGYLRDQFANDQRRSNALDLLESTTEHLAEFRGSIDAFAGSHRLVAGMDLIFHTLESERLQERGERIRVAAFAQDEWYLSTAPLVSLMPAMRAEFDTQFGPRFTPKLAGRWDIAEHLTLRAGVGMGYRAPEFRELLLHFDNRSVGYVIRGNPDLEPETSIGLNLGVEWSPARTFTVATSAYRNDLRNMIGFQTVSELPLEFSYVNIAEAMTMGVETALKLRGQSWSSTATLVFEDTEDRSLGLPLEGRSTFRGSLAGTWKPLDSTRMEGRARLTSRRAFYVPQEGSDVPSVERVAPYVLGSFRVDQELWAGLSSHVGIDNIFNAGSRRLVVEPRALFAGVSGRW